MKSKRQKITTFLAVLLWWPLFIQAQGGDMMMRNPHIQKMIEQERIPYFTKELNLTTEEAKLFWPLYDEYQSKLRALMEKDKALGELIMNDSTKRENDEKNYRQILQFIDAKSALKKEYLEKFKQVLPLEKVNKLMYIEHGFRMYLIRKRMRHRRSHMGE